MISVNNCPACGKNSWLEHLQCIDHTVSHETFALTRCQSCNLLATNPRPADEELGVYYHSDAYISHTSQAASLIDRLYLIARQFTLRWKEALIRSQVSKPGRLLDYGCGTGDFLAYCNSKQWSATGIEPSAAARLIASSKATVHQHLADLTDSTFETITLWHVLEHVPNPNTLLEKLNAILEKNGTLFIAVPNYRSYDGQHYQSHWAGYDVPRHLWHFTKDSMEALLSHHNMNIVSITPMKLDAFYVSMLSEKYIHNGNTTVPGIFNALTNGLRSNQTAKKTGEYSSLIYTIKKNEA